MTDITWTLCRLLLALLLQKHTTQAGMVVILMKDVGGDLAACELYLPSCSKFPGFLSQPTPPVLTLGCRLSFAFLSVLQWD